MYGQYEAALLFSDRHKAGARKMENRWSLIPKLLLKTMQINDNVDTENDAADDLTVSVKNIMNEAYCRDISVKTRSALEVKRRSGDFVGAFTIYGYVKVGDKHKSLEVDEYAANVVRDIFRKRLEGFSASHIADELNRLGILSPLAYKRNHGMPHATLSFMTSPHLEHWKSADLSGSGSGSGSGTTSGSCIGG